MKFENPIMNISMFEVENVVTASGETPVENQTASQKAQAELEKRNVTLTSTLQFN